MRLNTISQLLLTVLAVGFCATQVVAGKEPSKQTENPLRAQLFVQNFEQVAISPNGKSVAWVETIIDKKGGPTKFQTIYIKGSKNTDKLIQVQASAKKGQFSNYDIAWSPDNTQLAFLSDVEHKGQLQLYLYSLKAGASRKITNIKGLLSAPKWSADGKFISVLYTENLSQQSGAQDAQQTRSGVIKDSYYEQRLAIVDINLKKIKILSPRDFFVYEYDWAPDGKQLVFTGAKGNGNNNWFIAQLYAIDVTSGKMRTLFKPSLQIGRPAVSPDSKNVAFIMGLNSDEVIVGGDVYAVPIEGGSARNITKNRKATATFVSWIDDNNLLAAENLDGATSIVRINYLEEKIQPLYQAPAHLTAASHTPSLSLSRDRKIMAFKRSSFTNPPEIWVGEMQKWQQITHRNDSLKPGWGEVKNVHWKNNELDLQGWLVYPKDFDPAKKYPMVVEVHGGPSYGIQSAWPSIHNYTMTLPSKGYFAFFPNPRGSFGKGQDFTQANRRDFGYGDWQDILTGIDEVIRIAPVDPNRLGLTGWSYGGFMTMWGITQSQRFKAAMAGAGISNWTSYYGQNSIDQWLIPFFGKSVYDDPDVYSLSSPITFIKGVKTPTLIVAAEGDAECPAAQSYEFWHALKTQGVPTELIVYNNEGHAFTNPDNLRDIIKRTTDWFDHYLK